MSERPSEPGPSSLVVVGGLPGSGKTSVAEPLSHLLGRPLLDKDTIKEALLDSLGWADEDDSRRLGMAATEVLWALAGRMPSAILESNWGLRDRHAERLVALGRPLVQVHCEAAADVLHDRIVERSRTGRHPGHRDAIRPEGLAGEVRRLAIAGWPPLELPGPLLRVDTTSGAVDVEALARGVLVAERTCG